MRIKRTSDVSTTNVKVLVYGDAGAGKTTLAATLPDPIIISAEAGLLSLAGADLPYVEVASVADLADVYEWIRGSTEAQQYRSVCLDSVTEIAEIMLAEKLAAFSDGRQAYGKLNQEMSKFLRGWRDSVPKHVYFSAKLARTEDNGRILNGPSMPGKTLASGVSYYFDEVFALASRQTDDGETERRLLCGLIDGWVTKDRSGRLGPTEEPHLGAIIDRVLGVDRG